MFKGIRKTTNGHYVTRSYMFFDGVSAYKTRNRAIRGLWTYYVFRGSLLYTILVSIVGGSVGFGPEHPILTNIFLVLTTPVCILVLIIGVTLPPGVKYFEDMHGRILKDE